jgi:hypothetical protein
MQINCLLGATLISWKQTKDFFLAETTSNFQAATQLLTDKSAAAMQKAITSSLDNWIQAHPVVFRILNNILWAIDHPVISFVIIIFLIAIALSIFKALNRLLEIVGLSLLQAPFKLISNGFKLGWLSIQQQFTHKNVSDNAPNPVIPQNSQQRLAEISQRLQVLQTEHNELLQEAAKILALNKN